MAEIIYVKPVGLFPCQWEDFVNDSKRTVVTIYTRENAKNDGPELGITKGDDGIYDIVVDFPEITEKIARDCLEELSKITGIEYKLN